MTDTLHGPDWQRAAPVRKADAPVMIAMPEARPHGAMHGIVFGIAIVLPLYAAAALIYLLWA